MSGNSEAVNEVPQEGTGGISAVDKPKAIRTPPPTTPRPRACPKSRKPKPMETMKPVRKLLEDEEEPNFPHKMTEEGDENPNDNAGKEQAQKVSPSPARKRSRPSTSSSGGGGSGEQVQVKKEPEREAVAEEDVEPVCELDYILEVRTVKEYRCKWKGGCPQDDMTWIQEEDLRKRSHFKEIISEFEKRQKTQPARDDGKGTAEGKNGSPAKGQPSKRSPK